MSWQKFRYYSSVSVINLALLLFMGYLVSPSFVSKTKAEAYDKPLPPRPRVIRLSQRIITSGQPVRIVITNLGIDLPIDPGKYDPVADSWTLSGYHAQYATNTSPANDDRGNTFIYGHNNKYVFGPLKHIQAGDIAQIYTDNGHVLDYSFVSADNNAPDDTSIFDYNGPPVLTVQTCSGSLNEWRRMYHFQFVKVES